MTIPAAASRAFALAGQILTPPEAGQSENTDRRSLLVLIVLAPAACLVAIALGLVLLLAGAAQQPCSSGEDFTAPGALGGVAGTGLTAAQIRAVRNASPFAGHRVTPGTYLTTAYGPPWGGIQGAGITTSGGLAINGGAPHWYVIAVDPALIEHGTLVRLWPNPFGWRGPFLAADTGGAIRGRRIDFYDWRGRLAQYHWGQRQATATPATGAAVQTETTPPRGTDEAGCTTTIPDGGDAGALALPGTPGQVTVAPLANAVGHPLRSELLTFVRVVAGIAGRELVLTTGTNHSELTVSGNVSDHVLGLAGDFGSVANHFPIGGGFGTTLAAAALVAAGLPETEAQRIAAAGGGHNVCHDGWRVQVIWRTGGHYDHVHIGLKPGCAFTGVQTFTL